MLSPLRLVGVAVAVAALAGGSAASAVAAEDPATFGQQVAMCAQTSLGQRTNPPTITCNHDGMTMTFANFGEMVLHMKAHHG